MLFAKMKLASKLHVFTNVNQFLKNYTKPVQTLSRINFYNAADTDINNKKLHSDKGKIVEKKESITPPKKRKPNGLQKDCELKGPLKEFLSLDKASKIDVLKYTWKYIKENNLQNPTKKRQIIPDERLKQVLEKNEVDMLEMPKLLFKHMSKISDEETSV